MGSTLLGEPIQILKLNQSTGKYELDNKKLETIFLDTDLENVELSVVSIAGASRTGKSWLLNYLVRFLSVYYENESGEQDINTEWLSDKYLRLPKFEWRGGCDRHTTGIWIWSKIFTKTLRNGQRIGIVLMDTQGIGEKQCNIDTNVIMFASMLSSIQIFNASDEIKDTDLQQLELLTKCGRMAMANAKSNPKPFQQIMFLIRDWDNMAEYPYGLLGGKYLLNDQVLKSKPDSTPEINEVRQHLQSCFEETLCFLMPYPGDNVPKNTDFDGRLCDVNPEFTKNINDLVSSLLQPINISRSGLKQLNGQNVKPKEFYKLIQQYWDVFNSGEIPTPKDVLLASTGGATITKESDAVDQLKWTIGKQFYDFTGAMTGAFFKGATAIGETVFDKLFETIESVVENM